MADKLTERERSLMDKGLAIVVHCPQCNGEFFLGELPMPADWFTHALKFKCPNNKKHKLFMGPLRDPMHSVGVTIREVKPCEEREP